MRNLQLARCNGTAEIYVAPSQAAFTVSVSGVHDLKVVEYHLVFVDTHAITQNLYFLNKQINELKRNTNCLFTGD
jgi:hypothetical protein